MKPNTNYIVAGLVNRLSAPDGAPDASMLYWRSFSPFWWSVVQLLIAGLDQPYIWENYNSEIRQQILDLMLPEDPASECPDCEECEECPPPPTPKPQPGGGGAAAVGTFGLSIEELEGLLMNSIMGIQITDDGMLQVQYFPCCDWVDVGNISQIAQTATATGNKTSFKDAVTAGFKNLVGNLPEIPNAESSFNNPSTLKCVKATAIITVVQAMFNDILNQLQSMGGTEALIASLWATALDELGLKALATPFSIVAAANKYGVSGLADLIEDILGNSAFWESSICSLSYQMEAYNAITGKDMASFYSLMTQNTVIAAEEILDILDFIVPGEFQQSVTMQLSGTTCGCTALLPYAYTPPAAPGFHIDRLSFFGAGAVINAYPDLSGQVLEYPSTFTPPVGETAAAQGFKTTYVGVSAGAHITKACVIYASPGLETFLLSQIKAGFTHSGGAISQWSANAYGYRPDTGLWVNLAFLTESSPVADAQKSWLFSGVNINRVAICTKVLGVPTTGAPAYVTFNNLLFTGNIAGVGFVDLPAGQSPS